MTSGSPGSPSNAQVTSSVHEKFTAVTKPVSHGFVSPAPVDPPWVEEQGVSRGDELRTGQDENSPGRVPRESFDPASIAAELLAQSGGADCCDVDWALPPETWSSLSLVQQCVWLELMAATNRARSPDDWDPSVPQVQPQR